MTSETDSCRDVLAPYCTGYGLDLGFGGTPPIVPQAICIDKGPTLARCVPLEHPMHLAWDIFSRLPFANGTFGYAFSSHALEDAQDTAAVLREWVRVLKPSGHLVLFLPDQRLYEAHCRKHGVLPNADHVHADFSLAYVKARLPQGVRVVFEQFPWPTNAYSFGLVVKKI